MAHSTNTSAHIPRNGQRAASLSVTGQTVLHAVLLIECFNFILHFLLQTFLFLGLQYSCMWRYAVSFTNQTMPHFKHILLKTLRHQKVHDNWHIAHLQQECHNSKSVIFQENLLKVLKCYNFLWVQRRHNCSPAASFVNCVMTLYLLKVHLQTFLSIPITQKSQILSCDTLVANERYGLQLKCHDSYTDNARNMQNNGGHSNSWLLQSTSHI